MKLSTKIILISVAVLILFAGIFYFKIYLQDEGAGFKVNTILLKSTIKEGEIINNKFKITNLVEEQNFKIEIRDLKEKIFLNNSEEFVLEKGEIMEFEVLFKDKNPGVYFGALVITAETGKKEIPVILEIQSKHILFASNLDVAPEHKEVEVGEAIDIEIRIFNLNDTRLHTVEMTYLIKDLDGEIITSETENVVVGSEASITKTVIIPEDMSLGNYVFAVITKIDNSVSTSSYLFNVAREKRNFLPSNFNTSSFVMIFSAAILVFLCAIIFLFFYMLHERDKLFLELRRQQTKEMQMYMGNIEKKKVKYVAKARTKKEKKKIERKFKKIKKKAKKEIKKRQVEQRKVFKKLKRKKKTSEMKKKLGEWKKQGFNVNEFLIQTEKKEKNNLQSLSKQGYDVSALRK